MHDQVRRKIGIAVLTLVALIGVACGSKAGDSSAPAGKSTEAPGVSGDTIK
ncbi:MAG: hypothetical protein H0U41_06995, partial [Actinobacteria bacterium]|nr:hypothetical protein [Actinomycetota bacterium]